MEPNAPAVTPSDPAASAYESLDAMKADHEDLLRAAPQGDLTPESLAAVHRFLQKGVATGAILDAPADRRLAQGLLDYWKATLYTQRRVPNGKDGTPPLLATLLRDYDDTAVRERAAAGDQALAGMSAADREAARRVLLRLVRLEPEGRDYRPVSVRRAALEAVADPAAVGRVVQALASGGVLRVRPGATPADDAVGLRYDALARTWDQLRQWVRQRIRFREAAEFWDKTGRKREALLTGDLLADALRYRDLGPLEQDFADASQVEVDRLAGEKEAVRRRQEESERKEAAALEREARQARQYLRLWRQAAIAGAAMALIVIAALAATVVQVKAKLAAERANEEARERLRQAQVQATETERTLTGQVSFARKQADDATLTARAISQAPPRPVGWKLWRPGDTLRVRFVDGAAADHDRFLRIAARWSEAARNGVRFQESLVPAAEIRASFQRDAGVWSYVGVDSLNVAESQPTMNIGLAADANDAEWSQAVLRECGHALGLVNEVANPNALIIWNEEATYRYFGQHGLSREQVAINYLQRYPISYLPWYRAWDPASVMTFPIPAGLATTVTGQPLVIGQNVELSDGDKKFIAALYPPPGPAKPVAFGAKLAGECKRFRELHTYRFTLPAKQRFRFQVEIHQDAGFSLLRLPDAGTIGGRPTEVQTLIAPTPKAHEFRLDLDAGEYAVDLFGRIGPNVPAGFGPKWVQGEPIAGWDGTYAFTATPEPDPSTPSPSK